MYNRYLGIRTIENKKLIHTLTTSTLPFLQKGQITSIHTYMYTHTTQNNLHTHTRTSSFSLFLFLPSRTKYHQRMNRIESNRFMIGEPHTSMQRRDVRKSTRREEEYWHRQYNNTLPFHPFVNLHTYIYVENYNYRTQAHKHNSSIFYKVEITVQYSAVPFTSK